jgi:hypothetical protein
LFKRIKKSGPLAWTFLIKLRAILRGILPLLGKLRYNNLNWVIVCSSYGHLPYGQSIGIGKFAAVFLKFTIITANENDRQGMKL